MNSSTNRRLRTNSYTDDYKERQKQTSIHYLLFQLNEKKRCLKKLKAQDISTLSKVELNHYNKVLEMELKKRKTFIKKLSDLGYSADGRGRPRKNPCDLYKVTNKRMTIYLTPDTHKYLKDLNSSDTITNISSFINELISSYKRIASEE